MKLMFAVAALLLGPAGGPYPVTIPIDGLTEGNAAQLRKLLEAALGRHDRDGDGAIYEFGEIRDGHVTMVLACPSGTSVASVRAALAGSPFSLKLDDWELFGKFCVTWKSSTAPDAAALKEKLSGWGAVDVKTWAKGEVHHGVARLHLKEGRESVSWRDLTALLGGFGAAAPELGWDNQTVAGEWAVPCGARRAKAPPRPSMKQFLTDAIAEGLAADGAEPELVARLLDAPEPGLFVTKCPVCRPIEGAMRGYVKAGVRGPGKGWPAATKAAIESGERDRMLKALEEIVTRHVDARFATLRLAPADERHLKVELAEGRKFGMSVKREDFGDRCPSCEGAN